MKSTLIAFLLFLCTISAQTQMSVAEKKQAHLDSVTTLFASIATIEQAWEFEKEHEGICTLREVKSSVAADSSIYRRLKNLSLGDITSMHLYEEGVKTIREFSHVYKVLSIDSIPVINCYYIYLDGSKLSKEEIEKRKKEILERIKNGESIYVIHNEYSMDGDNRGIVDAPSSRFMDAFVEAMRNHNVGEVFTIDIPEKNLYYVALKTGPDYRVIITALDYDVAKAME